MYTVKGLDSNPLKISRSLCFTYSASVLVLVEKQRCFCSTSFTVCRKAATAHVWSPSLSLHGFIRRWERNKHRSMGLMYSVTLQHAALLLYRLTPGPCAGRGLPGAGTLEAAQHCRAGPSSQGSAHPSHERGRSGPPGTAPARGRRASPWACGWARLKCGPWPNRAGLSWRRALPWCRWGRADGPAGWNGVLSVAGGGTPEGADLGRWGLVVPSGPWRLRVKNQENKLILYSFCFIGLPFFSFCTSPCIFPCIFFMIKNLLSHGFQYCIQLFSVHHC